MPYRPGGPSAKLLPPILLVLLGTAFLAYRARSHDWRGISSLFETRSKAAAVPPLARTVDPPGILPELAPASVPKAEPAEKVVEAIIADTGKGPDKDQSEPKPTRTSKPEPVPGVDPREDIQREAEKTRARIADLEKLKDREARKLDETAADRQQADRLNRRFRAAPVAPEQFDRILRANQEQLGRQMAAMQRKQMERMAAMQRDLFNLRGPMRVPRSVVPPPRTDFADAPGRFLRPPEGEIAHFREFRGPNGERGFRFEFRQGPGGPRRDDVPPPPPPRPARHD